MNFVTAIEYPNMFVYVYSKNGFFHCQKYTSRGNKVLDANKDCNNPKELLEFLCSIPNAPTERIQSFCRGL